jgi:hypothetical protein
MEFILTQAFNVISSKNQIATIFRGLSGEGTMGELKKP